MPQVNEVHSSFDGLSFPQLFGSLNETHTIAQMKKQRNGNKTCKHIKIFDIKWTRLVL